MTEVEVIVPDGYEVVKTLDVVDNHMVEIYPFKLAAKTRCQHLNDERFVATYRWEFERINNRKAYERVIKEVRGKRPGFFERMFARWAVVPYQNILKKKEAADG
jgi:hypothetical protein